MSDDDYNWNDSDDNIAVAFQERIAVYTNEDGDIVIRQDGHGYLRDDAWIVVRPENARRLADAILALAEPTDRTAAERQRRYRHAKRNGHTLTPTLSPTVTARDGTVTGGRS